MFLKRRFYGWSSASICFIIVFCATGVAALTFNIFTIPVTEYYGISRTAYSITSSISSALGAIGYFCYGPAVKKIGVKRSILLGLLLMGLAYLLFASGIGVWTLYAKAIISGTASVFVSTSVLTQIINNWFNEERGLVIGVVCAASGIGGSLFSPILGFVLEKFGWQVACGIDALLILLCVPLVWLFLYIEPKEKGMEPLGGYSKAQAHGEKTGLTMPQTLRDWRFWLIALSLFTIHFANNPSYNNVTPHLIDSGMDPLYVTGIVMVVLLICNASAKPVMGMVSDKLGVLPVVLITCGLSTVSSIMMAFADRFEGWYSIFTVIVLGAGTPITTVVIPLIINRVFGTREYNTIMGFILAAGYVGTTVGTPVSNYIYDITGSYNLSYILCAAFAGATLVMLSVVLNSRKTRDNRY